MVSPIHSTSELIDYQDVASFKKPIPPSTGFISSLFKRVIEFVFPPSPTPSPTGSEVPSKWNSPVNTTSLRTLVEETIRDSTSPDEEEKADEPKLVEFVDQFKGTVTQKVTISRPSKSDQNIKLASVNVLVNHPKISIPSYPSAFTPVK